MGEAALATAPSSLALITGSRDGESFLRAQGYLLKQHRGQWTAAALSDFDARIARLDFVIVGRDDGFDGEAIWWCWQNERKHLSIPAQFKTGKKGGPVEGPIRNSREIKWMERVASIIKLPTVCLAFPGGKGTSDTMAKAAKKNVPVWRCSLEGENGWRWDRG